MKVHLKKAFIGIVAALAMIIGSFAAAGAARADSPTVWVVTSGGYRCGADWYSGSDEFGMADVSRDGRYCYIQWGWDRNVDVYGRRWSLSPDQNVGTQFRIWINTWGERVIWWKLCREVSGPDNCSPVRADAT